MKTIGERIKQARLELGWSGEKLALRLGYKTQSAIGNLENRATGRGGNKLDAVARVLNVSADWLLNGPDGDKVPFLDQRVGSWPPTNQHAPSFLMMDSAVDDANDRMAAEATALFASLSPAGKAEAIRYLRFLTSQHSPPIFGADRESDSVPSQRHA